MAIVMDFLHELHLLLTYRCTMECQHCFVWGSPQQSGVMTLAQVRRVYDQGEDLGTVESICFEGGEPFLYYGLLLESVRQAQERGWETGIVSNAYWATSPEDALLWLQPLAEAGLGDLVVSDDDHHGGSSDLHASHAAAAADRLGIGSGTIAIREAAASVDGGPSIKGVPIMGGAVRFRGRAAIRLTPGLPTRPAEEMVSCPLEELVSPVRVHIDPLGYVHLCQGLAIGNVFETPLADMLADYVPAQHPVSGPLLAGGPLALAGAHGIPHADAYADECQMCYDIRVRLQDRFPEYVAPPQMYGVPDQTAS